MTGTFFGRNLEAACKAYQRTKFLRLEHAANNVAEAAAKFPVGSPEWKHLVNEFVAISDAAEENGTPLNK